MATLPAADIRRMVRLALQEDLADGDLTTAALFDAPVKARATIVAQQPLVVAGLAAAVQTFLLVDPSLQLSILRRDGAQARAGDGVLRVEGDGRSILQAERAALNFMQHLSGIATLTQRFCRAVKGTGAKILDTRKTLPGWRALQKWAVALGGGMNHRRSLGDGLLIKDNHLALLNRPRTAVQAACLAVRRAAPKGVPVIVEVESLPDVRLALIGRADIVLLDNMTPPMVRRAVRLIDGKALVEVSGGITLDNVRAFAAAGADRISIGALTHSAPAAALHLVLKPAPVRNPRRR